MRRSDMSNHKFALLLLAFTLGIAIAASTPVVAANCVWDDGSTSNTTNIQCAVTASANSSAFYCNEEVTCAATASDMDHMACPNGNFGVGDQLSYTWTATAGSFKNGVNTGPSVIWVAPGTPTTSARVTCTVDDGIQGISPGDSGERDDDPVSQYVDVSVDCVGTCGVVYEYDGNGRRADDRPDRYHLL
ncbi:MAG: hypothetical protein Q7T82_03010 [Armatimonadota bacterium]|nr:hypothetical protein [Armatimonadota bacterium]